MSAIGTKADIDAGAEHVRQLLQTLTLRLVNACRPAEHGLAFQPCQPRASGGVRAARDDRRSIRDNVAMSVA